ncbi:hypothetical protein GE107_15435 [Cohnella sp. CFH 77786]|uniref:hypothetical protein n=1 Tax=Cohnella sp. CFH 77786 TaxID=2662265 RepID=UPI001C60FAB1|nr:hypothetical protein [Cohnella sp. CFH 77786]MBW5447450.1 hypothetical protein [Cohnella sp. CFH 77786]
MREAIRQRLREAIPALNGQAFEMHEDVSAAQTPYVVIVQGPDAVENAWSGIRRTYEIWPYSQAGAGFGQVDGLVGAIVQALDGQSLSDAVTGETFVCRYRGTVDGDRLDEAKTAITRGIRFAIWGIPDHSAAETLPADVWLTALGRWSEAWLGGGWRVHLGVWPPNLARPAVLWRIQAAETRELGSAAYEMRKRIVGHFLGPTANGEAAAVFEAAGRLQAGTKIALDSVGRIYLKVAEIQANLEADGLTAGQVEVALSRRMSRTAGAAPLMRKVGIHGIHT